MSSDKSHDRTGPPVVEGHEIQGQNSEKEQIGTPGPTEGANPR